MTSMGLGLLLRVALLGDFGGLGRLRAALSPRWTGRGQQGVVADGRGGANVGRVLPVRREGGGGRREAGLPRRHGEIGGGGRPVHHVPVHAALPPREQLRPLASHLGDLGPLGGRVGLGGHRRRQPALVDLHEVAGLRPQVEEVLLGAGLEPGLRPRPGLLVQVLHQRQQLGVGRVLLLLLGGAEHGLLAAAATGLLQDAGAGGGHGDPLLAGRQGLGGVGGGGHCVGTGVAGETGRGGGGGHGDVRVERHLRRWRGGTATAQGWWAGGEKAGGERGPTGVEDGEKGVAVVGVGQVVGGAGGGGKAVTGAGAKVREMA
ncbi:hypothetical protein ANANG_G00046870 [Anguilla anguilla]|uniref:Secreted protein n=1 Tax=Anguilla anguilla TaxID=7936 RepID=A0A9D3MU24_ANGAN|nr:hypothetical protein ANANG_G00046870 [Anguilla anguilla]